VTLAGVEAPARLDSRPKNLWNIYAFCCKISLMERYRAEIDLLERFELGKNTARNAGIEIKIYGKAAVKRGPLLGTIRIGQGSFAWWAPSAKTETETGKRRPTVRLSWSDFADLMKKKVEGKKRKTT
jgi:hypothetical protein